MQRSSHSLTPARSFLTHTVFVSVFLTSGYCIIFWQWEHRWEENVAFSQSDPGSKSQHKFCSCVLKRDLLECVPVEHEESDHTALIHSPTARQYQDVTHSESRESSASTETVLCRSVTSAALLQWGGSLCGLFLCLMYIHLQFHWCYGIMKHFNIQHSHVFIQPYKYYLFTSLKPQVYIFCFENKNKQCFKTKKNYNNTVIISIYIFHFHVLLLTVSWSKARIYTKVGVGKIV